MKIPMNSPEYVVGADGIVMFFHCAQCFSQRPPTVSPKDWARFSVGFTLLGVQVWCDRCNSNVIHIDFQGVTHPADMKVQQPPEKLASSQPCSPDVTRGPWPNERARSASAQSKPKEASAQSKPKEASAQSKPKEPARPYDSPSDRKYLKLVPTSPESAHESLHAGRQPEVKLKSSLDDLLSSDDCE
jgi:hypothetical protein